MSGKDADKALKTLLKQLEKDTAGADAEARFPARPADVDDVLHELVCSLLVWEASTQQAADALARINEHLTDYNELRMCYADELGAILGSGYPLASERADRMRHVLCTVFEQQHALTLDHLRDTPKREAKAYLDALPGLPPFVSARVMLIALGGHAFPVDERVLAVLKDAGVVEEDADADTASSQLERLVRAGEALPAYQLLEAYLPQAKPRKKSSRPSSKKKTSQKTTKKSSGTTKKASGA